MSQRYEFVSARARHRCEYCRAPEVVFNFRFEVEHIVPVSKEGSDEFSNLALACRGCNLYKSDLESAVDPETNLEVRIYHPRDHAWHEHFTFRFETCEIEGTTVLGRATVERLKMNHAMQRTSRRWWVALGLFP